MQHVFISLSVYGESRSESNVLYARKSSFFRHCGSPQFWSKPCNKRTVLVQRCVTQYERIEFKFYHVSYNEIWVHDGPHILQWPQKIILGLKNSYCFMKLKSSWNICTYVHGEANTHRPGSLIVVQRIVHLVVNRMACNGRNFLYHISIIFSYAWFSLISCFMALKHTHTHKHTYTHM